MIQLVAVLVLILASLDQAKSEISWDDDDWQIDGIKEADGTQAVIVENNQDVHGVAVQIKTDTISGSGISSLTVHFQSNGKVLESLKIYFKHMTYEAQSKSCHDGLQFPTDFPTAVQKVWTFRVTDEPDTAITITVNGVRVAELSANFCENINWGKNWKNTDFEAAEIKVSAYGNDVIDGYRVVGKEDPENDGNDNGETENEDNQEDNHNYSGAGYTNISTIIFCTLLCTIIIWSRGH